METARQDTYGLGKMETGRHASFQKELIEVSLRLPVLKDAETMLSWENNPENWAVSNINDSPYALADMIHLIESFKHTRKPEQLRFMIHSDELLLGAVDIFDINYKARTGAIGILIAEHEYRRMGFASRALDLVEIEARKQGIERLFALIHTDNERSIKLFEKMGYRMKSSVMDSVTKKSIIVEKWVKREL